MNDAQDPQQLQHALLHAERMASLGQLVAGIAHELNNPIGFILSNLNSFQVYLGIFTRYIALLEQLQATDDQTTRQQLQQQILALREQEDINFLLRDSAELLADSIVGAGRVRDLVLDLRRFSHPDQANWQRTELHALIHATLRLAKNELRHHVKVQLDLLNHELWLELQPSGISQVLMNMIINASHAIGEQDGSLIITTRKLQDKVVISLEDSGCGIAPEILPQIFDPFFTTKEVGTGTGLGLSICHSIILQHGGTIQVESVPGRTVFTILLPLVAQAQTE